MKLLTKQHEGKKVRYVYDPAKTTLQRILQSGVLPAQKRSVGHHLRQLNKPPRKIFGEVMQVDALFSAIESIQQS